MKFETKTGFFNVSRTGHCHIRQVQLAKQVHRDTRIFETKSKSARNRLIHDLRTSLVMRVLRHKLATGDHAYSLIVNQKTEKAKLFIKKILKNSTNIL